MKINNKGQLTIPAALRRKLLLRPGDEVAVFEVAGELHIRRSDGDPSGSSVVEHIQGRASTQLTTDDIMGLTRGDDSTESGERSSLSSS